MRFVNAHIVTHIVTSWSYIAIYVHKKFDLCFQVSSISGELLPLQRSNQVQGPVDFPNPQESVMLTPVSLSCQIFLPDVR